MLDRDDRDVEPDHRGGLARVVARRGDDVLARNVAPGRGHCPLAALAARNRGHFGAPVDLGAVVARALGQRHGQVGGRDVAVVGVVERAHQPGGLAQRPELLDLGGADHLEGHADGVRGAAIVVVLVHAVAVGRQAQIARLVEAHRLAGFGFQPLVEVDGVFVDAPDRIGHVEQRQQAGGVPGRAVGEVGLLDQHDIRPARLGEVVEDAHADHPAADHHHPCLCLHGALPPPVAFRAVLFSRLARARPCPHCPPFL